MSAFLSAALNSSIVLTFSISPLCFIRRRKEGEWEDDEEEKEEEEEEEEEEWGANEVLSNNQLCPTETLPSDTSKLAHSVRLSLLSL